MNKFKKFELIRNLLDNAIVRCVLCRKEFGMMAESNVNKLYENGKFTGIVCPHCGVKESEKEL